MPALALSELTENWSLGKDAEVLGDIYRPEINLACLERELPAEVKEYARFLSEQSFFTGKSGVMVWEDVSGWLNEVLPAHPSRQAFAEDVSLLADMFSCLFEQPRISIRLNSLRRAMCPRFHVDRVPCRLVTTYLGANTQWLPDTLVDRRLLGPRSAELPDDDSGLVRQVPEHSVTLLKGEGWWQNEGAGIVHRSPAAGPETPRIFLSFDFAD